MARLLDFLGKPRTIQHQINNRKISWLELFYDLMFAVVISRLTDGLLDRLTWQGFLNSILLFGWFIWGWNETSGYFDNHGNDSIINVLIINTEMILTGIGAIYIPTAIGGNLTAVTVVLVAIELLMALVWIGLAHFDRTHGPAARVWGSGHLIALFIMILGLALGGHWLLVGLILALLLNIFDVVLANPRLSREYHRAEMKHQLKDSMIERYGLMTMIALGEIIAGLYEPLAGRHLDSRSISQLIISLLLIALLAAIYYQVLGSLQIVLKSSIQTTMTGWLFILAIMFAYYLGVSMQLVLQSNQRLSSNLCFAVSLILFLAVIRLIVRIGTDLEKRAHERIIAFLLVVEAVIELLFAWASSSVLLIATMMILLVIVIQGRLLN